MGLKLFFIFSVVLIALDLLWLSYFSKKIGSVITKIQRSPMKVNPLFASIAYAIMCISYYFIGFENGKPNYFKGALLGLGIYGTYEFTNYATFKDWSGTIAVQDISWGLFLSVMSLYVSSYINKII
jgi:uncharacterized membrane protein